MNKTLELKLTNGNTIIRPFDPEKIYDIVGRVRKRIVFCRKFPFLMIERIDYTTFRYQDTYETITSDADSCFSVLLSISEFISALGVNFESYEEIKLKGTVVTGS